MMAVVGYTYKSAENSEAVAANDRAPNHLEKSCPNFLKSRGSDQQENFSETRWGTEVTQHSLGCLVLFVLASAVSALPKIYVVSPRGLRYPPQPNPGHVVQRPSAAKFPQESLILRTVFTRSPAVCARSPNTIRAVPTRSLNTSRTVSRWGPSTRTVSRWGPNHQDSFKVGPNHQDSFKVGLKHQDSFKVELDQQMETQWMLKLSFII
ncbi:hypothetical protein ElyMa_006223600 [Elysia marginata]|uniref:Uncharacterized protein n=1 Tax=Elysia marginata TaxID=1093978 RepID=A0AAV4H6R8_9GAST|nr:hypothetical protein ElyMa_006223600 [Elysia marginata]